MKVIGHNTKSKLLKVMIILGIILVIEIIIFIIYKNNKNCDIEFTKTINNIIIDKDNFITIGTNNYKDTEDEKYYNDHLIMQGEIIKYNKDLNIEWITSYYLDNDINLVDIVKVKDGYIAIGTIKKEIDNDIDYTGLLLKLNNEGKIINTKEYDLLTNTIFRKIVRDNNTNIIIGGSQYEIDRIGNHLGGGIILKVDDSLNILESNNYGGNKSGEFTNIFILNDSYLVYGVDANYPILVRFNKSFNRNNDDNDLISKKVISYKTFDKDINFNPMYYSNNKLYDGIYEYDIISDSLIKKNETNKQILLINENNVYMVNDKLTICDRDYRIIKEYNSNNNITKILPVTNGHIIIKSICKECSCESRLELLKDE